MTGRDLLDAIGYVDEELLERCQKKEGITTKNKIFWFWYSRKYVSIAACACLMVILSFTYWQYNFSGVDDTFVNEDTQEMTASSDASQPEEMEHLLKADDQNGTDSVQADDQNGTDSVQAGDSSNKTDSDLEGNTLNEADQDLQAGSKYDSPDDDYQPGAGVLADTPSGTENGTNTAPEIPDDTPKGNDPATDNPDNISLDYSQGIKIEVVKKIPRENSQPTGTKGPGGISKPAGVVSAKKILAGNTVIVRGTVKKIQHFHATGEKLDVYFSVVSIKVKEIYRADGKGNPQKGTICKVYLPESTDSARSETSIFGQLAKGREAILMPDIADSKAGIRKKGNFLAFLDVSDYYFDEKTAESHVFLKTKTKILYDTKIYNISYDGKKITLDDVGKYIRKMLKGGIL